MLGIAPESSRDQLAVRKHAGVLSAYNGNLGPRHSRRESSLPVEERNLADRLGLAHLRCGAVIRETGWNLRVRNRVSRDLQTRKVFPQMRHLRNRWPTSGAFNRAIPHSLPLSQERAFARSTGHSSDRKQNR